MFETALARYDLGVLAPKAVIERGARTGFPSRRDCRTRSLSRQGGPAFRCDSLVKQPLLVCMPVPSENSIPSESDGS